MFIARGVLSLDSNKKNVMMAGLFIVCILLMFISGCNSEDVETDILEQEEAIILQGEGVFTGYIEGHSVEITIDDASHSFKLEQTLKLDNIPLGSKVEFTYVETEERKVLKSIWPAFSIQYGEGILTGLIDSHSVEIKVDGEYMAFEIGEDVNLSGIDDGSAVSFQYREGGPRPVLQDIKIIEKPSSVTEEERIAEGIFIGQIDSQSIEIQLNRVFILGPEVDIENISDGSFVAFEFTESGPRAILDSIVETDQLVEGNVMHGTYIGQADSQSVEIEYYQAFSIGSNIEIRHIDDGSEVIFTYRESVHRPILTSIKEK